MGTCKHLDCRNFAPVDVVKGICHVSKELVSADGDTCDHFEKMPRCKFCQHYAPTREEFIGTCTATPGQLMTYPDLSGVTCEFFAWKQA